MKYTFKCPQCQQSNEIEMTISEYAEYEPVCEECKVMMERIYEMPQVKGGEDGDIASSPDDSSASDCGSCGSACSSCAGCGI